MNGRISTKLRREAERRTKGMPLDVTKALYKRLKDNYKMARSHPDTYVTQSV